MRVIEVYSNYEKTASYTYDENGNKATQTLTNSTDTTEDDTVSTYTYNLSNKIISIVNTGATQSSYEYSYYLDGSDSCKIRTENGIIEKIEYEYDGLKRLISETETIGSVVNTYTYEYDDYSNRIQMTASGTENFTTVYEYNNTDGEYTALLQKEIKTIENGNSQDLLLPNTNIQQTVYTYDANGNQITKTDYEGNVETYSYDGLNQLIGFTDDNNTASYTYNANGLRASKTVNGITIEHVWDGNKQIIADVYDTYNATCYVRGTSLLATYVFSSGSKTDKKYYLQNAHGDVVNLTDTDGIVIKTYKYDAFGVEKNIDNADTNPFRYCGEYYDSETGTIYLRARHYNPSNGRFTQRDSFAGKQGDPLSLNLYTYCHNNPIRYIDPSGHSVWDKIKKATKAVKVIATVTIAATKKSTKPIAKKAKGAAEGANEAIDNNQLILKIISNVDSANSIVRSKEDFDASMVAHSANVVNIGSGQPYTLFGDFKNDKEKNKYIERSLEIYNESLNEYAMDTPGVFMEPGSSMNITGLTWDELPANTQQSIALNVYEWDNEYYKKSYILKALRLVEFGTDIVY